jgi:hypothetical protein
MQTMDKRENLAHTASRWTGAKTSQNPSTPTIVSSTRALLSCLAFRAARETSASFCAGIIFICSLPMLRNIVSDVTYEREERGRERKSL